VSTPNLTFVHGFMGDPSDWDQVRSELPEYHITTPLIRPAEDWQSGVRQLVADIPARSVIIGYSMGARLALAIALEYPEVCAGLVFASGNPGLDNDFAREQRYAHDCRIAARIESEPRRSFLDYWYSAPVFRSLSEEVRQAEIERKSARDGDDWGDILRSFSVAQQPSYWHRLSELSMPTLAIAGMQDRKYTHIIERMRETPNIETSVVDNCGHIVHHERPLVFVRLLKSFLAEACVS